MSANIAVAALEVVVFRGTIAFMVQQYLMNLFWVYKGWQGSKCAGEILCKGQQPAVPTSILCTLYPLDKACFLVMDKTPVTVLSGPGCDQLVRGLGRWAAACELAHIVGLFSGTHTHLCLAGQDGPISSGKGACAVLSILSLASKTWAFLTAACWQLL